MWLGDFVPKIESLPQTVGEWEGLVGEKKLFPSDFTPATTPFQPLFPEDIPFCFNLPKGLLQFFLHIHKPNPLIINPKFPCCW